MDDAAEPDRPSTPPAPGAVDFSGGPEELHALRRQLADATDDLTALRAQHSALLRERAIERLDAEWEAALPAYEISSLVSFEDSESAARPYLPTRRGSLVRGIVGATVMILIIRYGPDWLRWLPALLLLGDVWWTVYAVRKAGAYAAAEAEYLSRRAELGGGGAEPR